MLTEIELDGGGVVEVLNIPVPDATHKTRDIAREEWALNFTVSETALLDKLKVVFATVVDPDLSFIDLSGKTPTINGFMTESPTNDAGIIGEFYAGLTFIDVARSAFSRYKEMTGGLSVDDARLIGSVMLFHLLGWLDHDGRKDEILMGVPYAKLVK